MGRLVGRTLRAAFELLRLLFLAGVVALGGLVVLANALPLPASPDLPAASLAAPGTRFIEVPADPRGPATGGAGTIATAIEVAGPADGPAVVLIHGFGGSTVSWRLTVPALAERGYRVVALDLADFGLSTKRWELDTTHAAQARHVLAVMDALGIERAAVVGHSMGANVAAHLALTAPDRIRSLVLVDAAIVPAGTRGTIGSGLAGALLELDPLRRTARQVIRRLVDDDRLIAILRSAYADPGAVTAEVAALYLAQVRTRDWDLALLAVVRDAPSNALPAPAASIAVPTLVVWGERDPWIPLARGEALVAQIPGAALRVVPGAGHLPFEEDPAAFIGALAPFLDATR